MGHWRGGRQRCRRDGSLTTTCLAWTLLLLCHKLLELHHLALAAPLNEDSSRYELNQSNKVTECLNF